MVFSGRFGSSQSDATNLRFDGPGSVSKFFLVLEQAVMKTSTDEKKAAGLLGFLNGPPFEFYYEVFSRYGCLTEEATVYSTVKAAFLDYFEEEEQVDDIIRRVLAARLEAKDLLGSFRVMDRLFEKAGFNPAAKFGLLRAVLMEHLDLAEFAVYIGGTDYVGLQKAVKDFWSGRQPFQSSAVYAGSAGAGPSYVKARDLIIVPVKKFMLRPDATVANDENKVDALADQLSQLTLLIKKQITPQSRPSGDRVKPCSFCKKGGLGVNRCPSNPHRDTFCPSCGKKGHDESTCWAKVSPDTNRKVGFRVVRSEFSTQLRFASNSQQVEGAERQPTFDQVNIIAETERIAVGEADNVAAAKRNAAGQASPKQARTGSVPVRSLLNPGPQVQMPVPISVERHTVRPVVPKPRVRKSRTKRGSKKAGIAELVGKYHMLEELAHAPCGLTFGQLMRGDADEAKREIRRLFSSRVSRSVLAHVGGPPRRLKVVSVRVYGTVMQALLDSGVVSSLMSARLCETLPLSPQPTTRRITVADGSSAVVRGVVQHVPVSFGGLTEPLDFLFVKGTPFDVIIGCPALEKLQACLDLGQQQVTIIVNGDSVQLGFEYDTSHYRLLHSGTDSEDFTSGEEDTIPQEPEGDSSDGNDEYVVAILKDAPFEPGLQYSYLPGEEPREPVTHSPLDNLQEIEDVVSCSSTGTGLSEIEGGLTSSLTEPYSQGRSALLTDGTRNACSTSQEERDPSLDSEDSSEDDMGSLPDLIDEDFLEEEGASSDGPSWFLCQFPPNNPSSCVLKMNFLDDPQLSEPSALRGRCPSMDANARRGPHGPSNNVTSLASHDTTIDDVMVATEASAGTSTLRVREVTGSLESGSEEIDEDSHAANLAAKLSHLRTEAQSTISSTLRNSGIVAWSLDELRPANVTVTHRFEWSHNSPIHNAPRRLPPRHKTRI